MRRILVWTLAAGMVLLAGQQAFAKEDHEDPLEGATGVLSPIPRNLKPGRPWTATITYVRDGHIVPVDFRPTVALTSLETGQALAVVAVPARPGVYTARIAFPAAGRWSIAVNGELTLLTVTAPAPAIPPSRPFPLWAWANLGNPVATDRGQCAPAPPAASPQASRGDQLAEPGALQGDV